MDKTAIRVENNPKDVKKYLMSLGVNTNKFSFSKTENYYYHIVENKISFVSTGVQPGFTEIFIPDNFYTGPVPLVDNNFTSWHETHFEITEAIINALDNDNNEALKIQEKHGRGGLYEYAKELTDKFEIKFIDEVWGETLQYMDEIEKFIEEEIYNNNHKINCHHPFNKLHHEKDGFLCMECGQFIENK